MGKEGGNQDINRKQMANEAVKKKKKRISDQNQNHQKSKIEITSPSLHDEEAHGWDLDP